MIPVLVIAGVLLIITFFLLLPVKLEVAFREKFSAQVRVLFLRFPLSSEEEKSTEEMASEAAQQKQDAAGLGGKLKRMARREGFSGFLHSLQELAGAVGTASKKLLQKLHLRKFDLYVCVGGEDAATAAIQYGQVSGVVYTACGLLLSLLPCRKPRVCVDLNYNLEEPQVDFSAVVSIRLLFLLWEGLILLYKALPFFRKLQGREDHTERISQTRKQGETK